MTRPSKGNHPYAFYTYGSSLSRALLNYLPLDTFQRVGFTARQSVISTMNPLTSEFDITGRRELGELSEDDVVGTILSDLERFGRRLDVIVWDLLDERFGVVRTESGSFITASPEMRRSGHFKEALKGGTLLTLGSEEHYSQWCAAASDFVSAVARLGLSSRLVIINSDWAAHTESGQSVESPFRMTSSQASRTFAPYYKFLTIDLGLPEISIKNPQSTKHHWWGPSPFNFRDLDYQQGARKLSSYLGRVNATLGRSEIDYDKRHGAPIRVWSSLEQFSPSFSTREHHVVRGSNGKISQLPLSILSQPGTGETLIVVLHGALPRDKYSIPRFEWLKTMEGRQEHFLFMADPGLRLSDDISLAWYTGTEADNVTSRLSEVVVAHARKSGTEKILFVGGSGGGYAAMALSATLPNSAALAFSPQIVIGNYWKNAVQKYLEVVFPQYANMSQVEKVLNSRLNLLDVYKSVEEMTNHVFIVQNSGDDLHMRRHIGLLAQQLGMPVQTAESSNGRMSFHVEYFGEGHGMPYRDVLGKFLDKALSKWN